MYYPQRKPSTAKELLTLFGARQSPGSVMKIKKQIPPAPTASPCSDGDAPNFYNPEAESPYAATSIHDADLSSISQRESSSSRNAVDTTSALFTSSSSASNSVYYTLDTGSETHGSPQDDSLVMPSTRHEQGDSATITPAYVDLFDQELPSYFHSSTAVLDNHKERSPDILSGFHEEYYAEGHQESQHDNSGFLFDLGYLPVITADNHTRGTSDAAMLDYIDPAVLERINREDESLRVENTPNDNQHQSESQRNIQNPGERLADRRIRLFSPISGDDDPVIDLTPKGRRMQPSIAKGKALNDDRNTPEEKLGGAGTPEMSGLTSNVRNDAEEQTPKSKSSSKKRRSTSSKIITPEKSPTSRKRPSARRSSAADKTKAKQRTVNVLDQD